MLLVVIFLAFTISLRCDATEHFMCQTYDESSKLLRINCYGYHQQSPKNCVSEVLLNSTSDVTHLKIEGCDQSYISDASEKYPNIQTLDISHSRYASLNWTGNPFQHVINLNVSGNELPNIPSPILSKFPNLETIDLSHNNIAFILNGNVKNCAKLKRINLSDNSLLFIDHDAFKNSKELNEINLRCNQFSTFPAAISKSSAKEIDMSENPELRTINCTFIEAIDNRIVHFTWENIEAIEFDQSCSKWKLIVEENSNFEGIHPAVNNTSKLLLKSNNSFKKIRSFVAGPHVFKNVSDVLSHLSDQMTSSMAKIDLSDNIVEHLNGNTFGRFSGLHDLILRNIGLKEFDFGVLSVVQVNFLRHLDISENDLKRVEDTSLLRDFANLKSLNAAGNRIQNANEIIQNMPDMVQELNLAGSNVGNIDVLNTIGKLTDLTHLNLSGTNLNISNANQLKPPRNLISFDISNNDFSNVNIDTILNGVNQLQEFRASNCHLKNVSEIIQFISPSVKDLDLSRNYIEPSINASLFQTLVNLISLNLSGINAQKFDLESLIPLTELRTLDISHNNLQWINLKLLSNFTQLERLYLNDNGLTKLDNFNWKASPNVSLAIAGNQFSCMYLKDLKHEIPNLKYIDNELDQKHGEDCLSSSQAIGDFLSSVYDKVKFW